jgi:SAM-dependent methyltransferase
MTQRVTSPPSTTDLRRFYKTSENYAAGLVAIEPSFFETYWEVLGRFTPERARVLEIGAGAAQTSWQLAAGGATAVAMDLSHLFLLRGRSIRRPEDRQPHLVAGDGTKLPFASNRFDVVCLHDVIEHIAEQDTLWAEVARVLKGGGHVIVISPNMLSPINTAQIAFRELRSGRWPSGMLGLTLKYVWITAKKLWLSDSNLRYQVVDVRDDMHSDQDACYMASPIDVRRMLERNGCRVVSYQRDSRTALGRAVKLLMGSFAPSIWIVAVRGEGRG